MLLIKHNECNPTFGPPYFVRAFGGAILVNFVHRETLLRSSMAGQMWNRAQGALPWCLVRPSLDFTKDSIKV